MLHCLALTINFATFVSYGEVCVVLDISIKIVRGRIL